MNLLEIALNAVELSENQGQKVIERGGELQDGFRALLKKLSSDQFANEEVSTDWAYPPEYKGPKPIDEQINTIAQTFGLDPTHALEFAKSLPELPDGAEGWFAIPRWQAVASTYGEAVNVALEKLGKSRVLKNSFKRQFGSNHLPQSTRTVQMLQEVEKTQKGDILIIATQFGLCHRGRSVRRVREIFRANEFGCGAFIVNSMTLTHPERFVRWEQLHTDHPGDEYYPAAGGHLGSVSFLDWSIDCIEFGTRWTSIPNYRSGSVSGFLPQ